MFTARLIEKSDYPVLRTWWDERPEATEWHEALLPPLGCLAEDEHGPAAAVWAYLTVGQGVAFWEYACTRPGMTLTQSAEAFQCAARGLEAACLALNYNYLVGYTRPGAERVMKPIGWEIGCPRPKVAFIRHVPVDACEGTLC